MFKNIINGLKIFKILKQTFILKHIKPFLKMFPNIPIDSHFHQIDEFQISNKNGLNYISFRRYKN